MSHILTLVASDQSPKLSNRHFDKITNICSHHAVQTIGDQIKWLEESKAGQISINNDAPMALIKELREALAHDKIDFFSISKKFKPSLIVADMESTIIPNEILDDLAEIYGIGEKIKEITERGMQGEIDFTESLRSRVALLAGTTEEDLQLKRDSLKPNPGAPEFIRTLGKDGITSALITGGFTFFSEKIANDCGFDHHHANILDIIDGKLSGQIIDPILDKDAKAHYMNQYLKKLGLTADNAIAIGDGANDLPMLEKAGLGIGYHPKPAVKQAVKNCILHGDLTVTLYALGYTKDRFVKPLKKRSF